MLPGTGYFRALPCPFYQLGFCERPYCHFRHQAKDVAPRAAAAVTPPAKTEAKAEPPAPKAAEVKVKTEPKEEEEKEKVVVKEQPAAASLEAMVQEAVRKVLLEGGSSALLASIDTSAMVAKVKQEKVDEDSDCCEIIEEVAAATVKAEVEEEPPAGEKPKLYLPPRGSAAYTPTPLAQLPGGLSQAASLASNTGSAATALVRAGKARTTYKQVAQVESVLGDLGDLTDSEDETFQSPDLLAGILREGNKSGVLVGGAGTEFEEQVIREKLKLAKDKEDKIGRQLRQMREECEVGEEAQCDKITSSKEEMVKTKEPVVAKQETDKEKAERKLREKEEEVRKLEEKRLMLENFYNAKLKEKKQQGKIKETPKKTDESKDKKSRKEDRSGSSKKKSRRKHSSVSNSDEDNSSEEESEVEARKSRKKHKKHSDHRSHKSSRGRSRESRRKRESSHKKKKRERERSSSKDSSRSSSEESRHKKKQKTSRKEVSVTKDVQDTLENVIVVKVEKNVGEPPKVDESIVDSEEGTAVPLQLKVRSMASLLLDTSGGREGLEDSASLLHTIGDREGVEDIAGKDEGAELPEDMSEEEDFVAEQGMSFMSAMDDLETSKSKTKKKEDKKEDHKSRSDKSRSDSKNDHKSSKSSRSEHKSSKSEHRSSKSEHKSSKSEHKSSRSDHKSSKSEHKSSRSEHKSSKSDPKSSSKSDHKSSRSEHKSSNSESKSSKSLLHHKPSSSSRASETKGKDRDQGSNLDDDDLDIPDLSEELALLPDDMEVEDVAEEEDATAGDFEKVADGLEDLFAGVEDEDELQRVFDSYKEEETVAAPAEKKKKEVAASSAEAAGRRRVALGVAETARPLHMKKPSRSTPQQAMHDRYKKLQALKQQQLLEEKLTELTEEGGEAASQASTSTGGKRRVAHATTANPVEKSKAKQQLASRQVHGEAREGGTAAVTCPKGGQRTAHTPAAASLPKPLVTPDPHSKVPTAVRQRYLSSFIDECLRLVPGDELAAHARAEREEAAVCRKASSRMIYLNLAVNAIKRLRGEAVAAAAGEVRRSKGSLGAQLARQGETTHLAVLAGKGGTTGTWSIEKREEVKPEDVDEATLYRVLARHVLTEEQLVDNGYPRPDPAREGGVVMKVEERQKKDPDKVKIVEASEDKRLCCRCGAIYRVDAAGLQEEREACTYHWGRCFRAKSSRERYNSTGVHSKWTCCEAKADEDGCTVAAAHVTDTLDYNAVRGFVATLDKGDLPGKVFALDCEMCNTTVGNELTRVTVVDHTGETCYETLVMPTNPIVDYNTRFSGITAEDMAGVVVTLRDVQASLLARFSSRDALLGHSLESDLRALRLVHDTVVDTSVVFPHNKGPPFKRALRTLVQERLRRIIQDSVDGHDSREDALACLDLMKGKAVEEVRKLRGLAAIHTSRRDNYLTDPEAVQLV